ncbi:MAG: phenylalanine--tRNA ligase subunit alpha, partial [Minisyncoccales bacterium]
MEEKEIINKIKRAGSLEGLRDVYDQYLGPRGKITLAIKSLKDLPLLERKKEGERLNRLKKIIEEEIKKKEVFFKKKILRKNDFFDISFPGKKVQTGHLHPLTLVKQRVEDIFQSLGFEVIEGLEIEDEFHNFDALNIPSWHPARESLSLGKTFYLKKDKKYLLRSHTSSVQIRYMEKNNPPFKIIIPGRVFRLENIDASHEIDFWQLEGLMVDKDISLANFKSITEEFFKRFFAKNIEIRFRPSYFPFVEPGVEVDVSCPICKKRGCSLCKKTGWLEMGGAGMVHPYVFKAVKLNPQHWQGFAFGFGLTRLAMVKYKIP